MKPKQRGKSSGLKRKRVDDGTAPSSPETVAVSARPDWDKITFRVSRIPERLEIKDLTQVLVQIFGVTVTNFSIHSLALDASDKADPPSKTATVSFRAIPALLRGSQDVADDQDFELPAIAAAEFGHCRISFDTHFDGFTPLSPADHVSRPIDCIVIPGWGGHALGSFRSHTSPYLWLRDSLPRHCPELRVWIYGYPSHLTDVKSSADLYEFAERFKIRLRILRQQTKKANEVKPLIFMAHSLGGWIFKDAMIQMRKSANEVDQETILSTYGALFFGVPTQGMNVEAIANMVQNLPARYISTLLDQKDGFRLRQRHHEDFCQAFDYKDSKIVQFFELEKSPTVIQNPETKDWSRSGPLALLVNPASATHGRAWETGSEYTFSLAGNHSSMIKFSNDRDEYPTVRSCLQQFTKQAALVVKNRWKKSFEGLQSSDPDYLSSEQQHCLQSLYYSEMNERRNGIEDPVHGTCEWLSKNRTYLKWFDQQHGMLWIKGKPGAGKSTLMKHAVSGLEQFRGGGAVLASFFFHGRGALIQKNIAGLFRSLLHQLLLQLPELLTEFSSLHKKRTESQGQCGIKWEWHEKELQKFFKAHITEAAKARTVRLYIDALDEAGEDAAIELVHYLQQFSSSLAVCFSCRHYPLLTLENGLEICVEDGNGQDIDTYVRTGINTSIIPLRDEIVAKSLGSFQWAVLVVRLILRLHRNGKSMAVLESKIEQLPSDLNELYKELLGSLDEEDLSESLLLMQWILFSFRPLRLSELRFALVMGQESTCTSIRECQSSSWFLSTDKDLKRKVLALSRGLLDVRELRDPREDFGTSNDDASYDDVSYDDAFYDNAFYDEASNDDCTYDGDSNDDDFVSWTSTETVSERSSERLPVEKRNGGKDMVVQFIHQSVKDFLLEGGLQILEKGHLNNMVGRGHFSCARSCIRYLTMEDVRRWAHDFWDPNHGVVISLLTYAAQNWHLHSKEVEKRDPAQADVLSMTWRSPDTLTKTWIRVCHMLNRDHDPDFPKAHWSLLHVASRLNLPSVVSAMLDQGLVANMKVEVGRTPLSIASRARNDEVVKMLLDRHDEGVDVGLNAKSDLGFSPLFEATLGSSKSTVKLLLDRRDVDPNGKDNIGSSPLSEAVHSNCEAIVKLLLDRNDVDPNTRDYNGRTPLILAARSNHKAAIVKLLLNRRDIDSNTRDDSQWTPLFHAVAAGNEDIVKLLLGRNNVDPNTQDRTGLVPLAHATIWDRIAVVRLLLDRNDIKANVKDRHGLTSLHYATAWRNKDIAQLLLDRDEVDPNIPDINGITPLVYATSSGHPEIATMLRDRMRSNGIL